MSSPLDTRLDREEGGERPAPPSKARPRSAAVTHGAPRPQSARSSAARWRAPASMRRRPPAFVLPTKPPLPSSRSPTRRNWSTSTATVRRLPRPLIAETQIASIPKSWRWRGALPARRRPTSPKPPSLNCLPGRSLSRQRNDLALFSDTPAISNRRCQRQRALGRKITGGGNRAGYLPMQKSRKITSRRSSTSTAPVMRPRLRSARRKSSARNSGNAAKNDRRNDAAASSSAWRWRARVSTGASMR